jgi:hypothetical protein
MYPPVNGRFRLSRPAFISGPDIGALFTKLAAGTSYQEFSELVRLIGNPVTMGQMTRHQPAAGSCAPVTNPIQELSGGGTQVAYDSVASATATAIAAHRSRRTT